MAAGLDGASFDAGADELAAGVLGDTVLLVTVVFVDVGDEALKLESGGSWWPIPFWGKKKSFEPWIPTVPTVKAIEYPKNYLKVCSRDKSDGNFRHSVYVSTYMLSSKLFALILI